MKKYIVRVAFTALMCRVVKKVRHGHLYNVLQKQHREVTNNNNFRQQDHRIAS